MVGRWSLVVGWSLPELAEGSLILFRRGWTAAFSQQMPRPSRGGTGYYRRVARAVVSAAKNRLFE